jgi:hypothetical protein
MNGRVLVCGFKLVAVSMRSESLLATQLGTTELACLVTGEVGLGCYSTSSHDGSLNPITQVTLLSRSNSQCLASKEK